MKTIIVEFEVPDEVLMEEFLSDIDHLPYDYTTQLDWIKDYDAEPYPGCYDGPKNLFDSSDTREMSSEH